MQVPSNFQTQLQFILPLTIPLASALPNKMTSLDRKLVAGDQFSFSGNSPPGVEQGEDYGLAFGDWPAWHCDNYRASGHHNEPDWLAKLDSKSPVNQPLSPAHSDPTSRVQAVARYKKETLELVKDAPEYAYELSLRDLVELPRIAGTASEFAARERLQKNNSRQGGQEKVKKTRRHSTGSVERGGLLLKMFFPMPSSGTKRSSRRSIDSLKPSSRSSSSGCSSSGSVSSSSNSSSISSSSRTSNSVNSSRVLSNPLMKDGSNSRLSPKPLMKDGSKPGADKSSEQKFIEMQQHGALSRNCSRHQTGCYPFSLNQKKKSRTKRI